MFVLIGLFLLVLGVLLGAVWWGYSRTLIAINGDRVLLRVPSWHGAFPMPPMRQLIFASGELRSVEHREEVRRSLGTTALWPALLVETTEGRRIFAYRCLPGYAGEMPLKEIAAEIGSALRCAVTDRGVMEVGGSFRGNDPEWQTPALDAAGVARVKSAATRWRAIFFWVMVAALALQLFEWLH